MAIRPPSTPDNVWKAQQRAFKNRRGWDQMIREVYQYILVYRDPADRDGAKSGLRMRGVFDSTAVSSSMRFAGRLKNDIAPALQSFFTLELGPAAKRLIPDQATRTRLESELETIGDVVHAAIDTANFHTSAGEMCVDLVAGMGALQITQGDSDEPVVFEAVPAVDIAVATGRGGKVTEVHYTKELTARQIQANWPSAANRYPKELQEALAEDGDSERCFEVAQSTFWNADEKHWELHVVMPGDGGAASRYVELHEEESRTCPWLTPRFYKVPGEPWGRGPAMMALPDVRVVNKTVELTLRAAALAILGLWTRTQGLNAGGTVNLQRLAPGSMIPVASNGGPRGREIEPLDVPRNFDVSNLMVNEYRERVRELLFDRAIPQSKGQTPRSASEVIENIRIYAEDLAVVYGRLVLEFVVPLVSRVIEILYDRQIIATDLKIDQLHAAIKVVSPLADAQNTNDLMRVIRWLELTAGLMGEEMVHVAAKTEEIPHYIAEKLGVPKRLPRTKEEAAAFQDKIAQIIAARQEEQSPHDAS